MARACLALQYHSCRRSCLVARYLLGSAIGDMRHKRVAASFSPSDISPVRITAHIRFNTTLLPAVHTSTRRQECYDDAMNSSNEHGIIHPDACTAFPIDKQNELPEESSVRTTSQNHDIVPGNDDTLSSSPTAADQSTQQLAEKGMSPAIEPTLLSALEDIFEVARPEVAASAVVAGVCKVRYWMTGVKGGIRRGWVVWYGEKFSNLSYLGTVRYPYV